MKKPVVDYRTFRLSKINTPEFSHLKLLLGWAVYFVLFFITENFIPVENCYVVYSPLDDIIPFCEVFVIPYVLWYLYVFGSLLYFALYNVDSFKRLMIFLIFVQLTAMLVYIVFPNRQDLRPTEFPRDNILSDVVGLLYQHDTNTNVCPSMHVAFSIAVASAWLKEKAANIPWKAFSTIFAILVCLSTAFIKQHSVVDAFVALPFCLVAECIAYGKSYWLPLFKKSTAKSVAPDVVE